MSTPSDKNVKASFRIILALSLVHFTGDFYNSFTTPLFPLFVEKLNLSLVQVGIIAGLSRFLAFIVQPSVGYLADRYQTRVFVLGGLLLPVVFIPLSGIAPSFMILLPCIAIGSIGSSMFHPSLTGMVPLYAGRNAGLSMSLFNTGGTLSFAVGPLFITWYAAAFGLEAVPATMLIGIALAAYLYFVVPNPRSEGLRDKGFFGTLKETLGDVWKPILLIWSVMVLRSIVGQSFLTYMPVFYVSKGYSLMSGGMMYALFSLAGTASGIMAGHLSDRIGFKPIFIVTHALMSPALLLLLYLPGNWIYSAAILAGFFTLATMPLGVVMAQTLAPRGRSMVASLMMGLAFGLGGLTSPVVGKLADLYSIEQVLFWVGLIPFLSLALILRFPEIGTHRR
jgi:MFS transporter, FSR family, fosmidomycin resistance protein